MVDSAPEFSLYDYSADLRSFSSPEEAAEGHVDFDGSFASDLVRIPTSELLPGDPNLFNDTDSGIFNHSGLPNIHGRFNGFNFSNFRYKIKFWNFQDQN